MKDLQQRRTWAGLGFSIIGLVGWLSSLIVLVTLDSTALNPGELILTIALRTVLQTGLFILAHDAMHQSLCPSIPHFNHALGAIALWCYAGLDYRQCHHNHFHHHHNPGTAQDQDLQGKQSSVLAWYANFITNYLNLKQVLNLLLNISLLAMLSTAVLDLRQSCLNLALFYFLPLILSSLQLFIFGTYLPHREICGESPLPHHSRSLDYPQWLSLLLCFHFGYHWEHHEYPQLPWYQLPTARQWRRSAERSSALASRELSSVL